MTNKEHQTVTIVKNAAILRDSQGNVLGAVETIKDMTEMVRKQEEIISLRKSLHLEEGYHSIVGKSATMQRLFELIENVGLTAPA
jgi:transcriptional regulator with PAS, ATPase and Fis domain